MLKEENSLHHCSAYCVKYNSKQKQAKKYLDVGMIIGILLG